MNEHIVDTIARGAAAALTRRRSLTTLGGLALAAAVAAPGSTPAGKDGKKAKKKAKKKCKRQDGQCAAFFENLCEEDECEPEELEAALQCCTLLRTCNAGGFMECIFDLLTGGSPS